MGLTEGKWVRLDGEVFDIREVASVFGDLPRVTFAQTDDGRWWMKAELFDPIEDAAEIRSVAADLVGTINGCAQLLWKNYIPVSAGRAVYFKDSAIGRNEQVELPRRATERTRAGIVTAIGGQQPAGPPPRIAWLRAAIATPDVASVLRIVGKPDPTWSELYHLIELVETLMGQTVSAAGWISSNKRRKFSNRTANSRRALGEHARHGHDKFEPPKKPMSLEEAQRMAREVTERFLNSLI